MRPREWLMLLALSMIWGGSFLFAKLAVSAIPPFGVVAGRVAIASLCLAITLAALGVGFPRSAATWRAFFGMGLLNNVIPFSLIFWGQTTIGAGMASILNATTPLFTVLAAHGLTGDERLTWNRIVGVLVGFTGVAMMIGPELLEGLGSNAAAQIACLGGAVSYAFAGLFGRRFARMGVPPLHAAFGQLTASSLIVVPLLLAFGKPWTWTMPGAAALGALVALAVLCTAFAYVLFFSILGSAGATNISLVTFLIPPSAILLGAVFLGERLGWTDFAGMGLIVIGLAAIDPRVATRLERRARTTRADELTPPRAAGTSPPPARKPAA